MAIDLSFVKDVAFLLGHPVHVLSCCLELPNNSQWQSLCVLNLLSHTYAQNVLGEHPSLL